MSNTENDSGALRPPSAAPPADLRGAELPSGPGERTDLLSAPFSFPKIEQKRVLVAGIGGGCDIITAYALAQQLRPAGPQALVYANTKRRIHAGLTHITKHIYAIPPWMRMLRFLASKRNPTRIEQRIPPGDEHSPWVFLLSRRSESRLRLAEELAELAFDLIVAVDTGGDAVVETATSGDRGTDKLMLATLKSLGVPFLLVVAAPGCDGEASFADLVSAFDRLRAEGRYAGCFSLQPMLPVLATYGAGLESIRTANIILAAHERRLQPGDSPDTLIVPRGLQPAIPSTWLLRAFVFQY